MVVLFLVFWGTSILVFHSGCTNLHSKLGFFFVKRKNGYWEAASSLWHFFFVALAASGFSPKVLTTERRVTVASKWGWGRVESRGQCLLLFWALLKRSVMDWLTFYFLTQNCILWFKVSLGLSLTHKWPENYGTYQSFPRKQGESIPPEYFIYFTWITSLLYVTTMPFHT